MSGHGPETVFRRARPHPHLAHDVRRREARAGVDAHVFDGAEGVRPARGLVAGRLVAVNELRRRRHDVQHAVQERVPQVALHLFGGLDDVARADNLAPLREEPESQEPRLGEFRKECGEELPSAPARQAARLGVGRVAGTQAELRLLRVILMVKADAAKACLAGGAGEDSGVGSRVRPRRVVAHDSDATGRRAADELLKLNLARYAFLPYRQATFWSGHRERGFCARLSEAGATADVLTVEEVRRADLRDAGVFAANDEMAFRLLARLRARGLRVPEDVALISADDTDAAAAAGLTSIRIDFEQGGYLAAKCLSESLGGRRPPHEVLFGDICIRPRPSTHHFARHLPRIPAAVALIRERATAGLTAREVVTFLGCSRRKAETAFRRATGRSILEEIQDTRLEFVRNRLSRGSPSIQSLTDFCGYRTPQALRKAFRRHTGMSMAEWRRRQTPLFAEPT